MRLTRCRLRPCRCPFYGASVKSLEPCTLMWHSGITLLSSYLLCCFRWLFFPSSLYYCDKKVRQLRMELTTLSWWDLRAADCAIVALSFMVHQWSYWSLERWCGISEQHCRQAIYCADFGWLFFSPACITVTKTATIEDRTHYLKIMRLKRCRLRHCRCLRCGASVKFLEPCTLMQPSGITQSSSYLLCWFWLALVFPSTLFYCDKKCDKWGSNSPSQDYETYALPTAPLSHSPLWCISEVIGALYVDSAFRSITVVWLYSLLLLGISGFSPPV